jgi:hypothetical protein
VAVLTKLHRSPIESRRQIRQVARATSIRLISRESTGYENALANSSAYRRAKDTQDDPAETLSRLSTGTNAAIL